MCGIVGFYLKSKNKQKCVLDLGKAITSLEHRGPDNQGYYYSESRKIGLGHTRLSIQDVSLSANQPMITKDKRFIIIFNGEIYNFLELRESFSKKIDNEFNWETISDTEVLLNIFSYYIKSKKSIKEFLLLLNGMFSFAIWDSHTEELFIARDAIGIKPLYYVSNNDGFFFSSEIKSLINLGINIGEVDYRALDRYLTYIWCPGEETASKNVKKFLPGNALIIKKGIIKDQFSWYSLPIISQKSKIFNKDICVDLTRKYLREAVKKQMISNVPVGAFLSGGLDSSSIVSYAREFNPKIDCFTIKSKDYLDKDGYVDDYSYAVRVSKLLNVSLHVVEVDDSILINSIEDMIYQLDEPIADPAAINVYLISNLARKYGIKVLLSGTGGDDIFSGYRRHLAIELEPYWNYLPYSIRKFLKNKTSNLNVRKPLLRRFREAFRGADLDEEERLINYFSWIEKKDLQRLYSDNFLQKLNDSSSDKQIKNYLSNVSSDLPQLEKMLLIEQRFYLPDHNLLYTDKMSMKAGVEVRVPFLDLDLVDFASQIPNKYKQRGFQGKWILKKAMEAYLPKEIIYRPKTGFGVPIRKWVKNELKDWIYENLSPEKIKARGLFDPSSVKKLIEDNLNENIDASWTLFSMACIEIWLRKFKDD